MHKETQTRIMGVAGCVSIALALLCLAPAAQAAAPSTTTGAATAIQFDSAVLNGTVNPQGIALEECLFEYGETEAYGQTAPCKEPNAAEVGSGTSDVAVHAEITGLTATGTYHFRLAAKSSGGAEHGSDQAFETAAGPEWKLTVTPNADYVLSGSEWPGVYKLEAENVGVAPTSGPVTFSDVLPGALSADAVAFYDSELGYPDSEGLCPTPEKCEFPGVLEPAFGIKGLQPQQKLVMTVRVPVPSSFEGPLAVDWKVSGGGAPPAEASASNEANPEPAFGKLSFHAAITDASKANSYTQAGGHPFQFSTEFDFGTYSCAEAEPGYSWADSGTCPMHDPKDITGVLPQGLIANPEGVPHCPLAAYFVGECEANKVAVGWAGLQLFSYTEGKFRFVEPIYNLQPTGEYPGELGITVDGAPFIVVTTHITPSGSYGITANNVAIESGLSRVRLTFWGVPADEAHNQMRGKVCWASYGQTHFSSAEEIEERCESEGGSHAAGVPQTPFLTMPTECSGNPLAIRGRYDAWAEPGNYAEATDTAPAVDGCNNLSFEPTIEARPTTNLADAPSGLEFHLHVPQNEDPEGVATPALKEAVVRLPEGLKLNPASADGLAGCSEAQIDLHGDAPAACPEASKLGTVEANTKLLSEPIEGSLYLATPHQNPAHALLAAYIVLEGQGVKIKLPGSFETDPQTGQITARFPQAPQLPFENLKLDIFGGARGALRTPATCGSFETTTSLTPYSAPESGPPATPSSVFETSVGPGGGECAAEASEEPNAPRFLAGTETPQAGIYSPFSLKLVRDDGSQELSSFDVLLPPGLTARLAGIPYCPDAALATAAGRSGTEEKASPSCPAASEVGTVDVSSGAGPTPINVPGHAYLAGPYKGAPLSLAFITPVLAGPLDLGTAVVRAAVHIDPETVQNLVVSDPLPTILRGIPLDIRSVTVKLDRRRFTLNPTSCDEFHIAGSTTSTFGVATPLSEHFQVGDCAILPFKPRLNLSLSGGVHRNGHPRLRAVVTPTPGGANLSRSQVILPPTELVDNSHLREVCSKQQFEASECPKSSVYGRARAETPLLSEPLEGPVFLQPSTHRVPDLVAALHSGAFAINVHLRARQDSVHESIRTTFENIPDVPLTRFVLSLPGGKKGLLVNSEDLCAKRHHIGVRIGGQNGKVYATEPLLRVACGRHRTRGKS
jgi:hypothetical protein